MNMKDFSPKFCCKLYIFIYIYTHTHIYVYKDIDICALNYTITSNTRQCVVDKLNDKLYMCQLSTFSQRNCREFRYSGTYRCVVRWAVAGISEEGNMFIFKDSTAWHLKTKTPLRSKRRKPLMSRHNVTTRKARNLKFKYILEINLGLNLNNSTYKLSEKYSIISR